MTVAVNIFITDNTTTPLPIANVVANVYDSSTFALMASATSDAAGRAAFSLPGSTSPGTTYEVRFFKVGVLFSNPQLIQVFEPVVTTNNFNMAGTLLTLDVATDPRCCRCTGRLLDYSNRPLANVLLRIMARAEIGGQIPKVVDGNLISAEAINVRTDENGFITVDLLRGGCYWVMYSGEDDNVVSITVPDRSSVNLIDLLYPQPVNFAWNQTDAPSNAISVTVGNTVLVGGTLTFSDYSTITMNLVLYLTFATSNSSVATVGDITTSIPIFGQGPGTTTITVSAVPNLPPSRVPGYSVTASPLTVTVS